MLESFQNQSLNILIIRLSSLGDIVHTFPAITDLKKIARDYNIDLNIDWLVEPSYIELVGLHPGVRQIFGLPLRRFKYNPFRYFKKIWNTFKLIRQTQYQYVFDFQGLIKSAIVGRFVRAKHRVGYDRQSIREKFASFFYSHTGSVSRTEHAIQRIRLLVAQLLQCTKYVFEPYTYGLRPIQKQSAENYVIFVPGTSWPNKNWPMPHWKALAELCVKHTDSMVYISWGDLSEFKIATALAESHNRIQILPKLSFPDLANRLSNAQAVISGDTGLGHLAAAYGVPVYALFGPTDPSRSAPQSDATSPLTVHIFTPPLDLKRAPCLKRTCYYREEQFTPCLYQIPPASVWASLRPVLKSI